MASLRERPYAQFNFLVDLGDGNTEGVQAGFQEVSGISSDVVVTEYRNGNSKENSVIKLTGGTVSTTTVMESMLPVKSESSPLGGGPTFATACARSVARD